MLIPIPTKLKDGTSTEYKALLYSVTKYHIINQDSIKGYDDGFKIKILGITIYDNINTYLGYYYGKKNPEGRAKVVIGRGRSDQIADRKNKRKNRDYKRKTEK